MRKLITGVIIGVLGFYTYDQYRERTRIAEMERAAAEYGGQDAAASNPPSSMKVEHSSPSSSYRCDGRQHCSQMKSCDEARWMLSHCPGMKMDGDNDGSPCEGECGD
jgi:hypothetical protein